MADTLKDSFAELVGRKPSELDAAIGPVVIRDWKTYLRYKGFELDEYPAGKGVKERHVVVYVDPRGHLAGVLSDSDEAGHVLPLLRVTVRKAGGQKAA